MKIKDSIETLQKLIADNSSKSVLFNFKYKRLSVSAVYFSEPNTFLLGIENLNLAWNIMVKNHIYIKTRIPDDVFKKISQYIYDQDTTDYSVQPFFDEFAKVTANLKMTDIKSPERLDIIRQIKNAVTKDKKYDNDGDNPYFSHWRRHRVRKPEEANLEKTGRNFGDEIMELCRVNKISSIWKKEPSDKSLDFIDKKKVERDISN